MINEIFGLVAQIWPGAVFVSFVLGIGLLTRTWSRVSSGSIGAGPPRVAEPLVSGLQRVPWELHGITDSLANGNHQPLDLLLRRADSLGVTVVVPDGPPQAQIDSVLDQLETALELPPLTSTHLGAP